MKFASDWDGLHGRLDLARFISMLVSVGNSSGALSRIFFIHGIGREETDCVFLLSFFLLNLFYCCSTHTHGHTVMKWQQHTAPYAMTIFGQGRLERRFETHEIKKCV